MLNIYIKLLVLKALFGWERKVEGKKVRGKNAEGMNVSRKWDDCLVVWFEWKWIESERKERFVNLKWQNYPQIKIEYNWTKTKMYFFINMKIRI
jgi:hypothetical protein